MALKKLKETTIIKIIDPETEETALDSKGKEMFVEAYSADSKKFRKVTADIARENEGKKSTKKNNDKLITEQLAHLIASWNIEDEKGNVQLSIENAIYILDEYRYVRDAILETITDRKNFLLSQ